MYELMYLQMFQFLEPFLQTPQGYGHSPVFTLCEITCFTECLISHVIVIWMLAIMYTLM